MINFREIQPDILDIQSGQLFNPDGFLKVPQFIKEEVNPLETEIDGLRKKGYNIDEVNQGIDLDDSIQDKPTAKELVSKVYGKVKEHLKQAPIGGAIESIKQRSFEPFITAFKTSTLESAKKYAEQPLVERALDFMPMGMAKVVPKNLTTKFLEYAKGKTILSKQEIMDFARRPELKKGEADLLNKLSKDLPEGKLPAQEFADSIRRDLLELKPVKVKEPQYIKTTINENTYERIGRGELPKDTKVGGYGKNYEEVVFESPITTNGSSHFPNSKNYFAHARGDEVVEGGKKIWREQEIQSDLLQKDNLDRLKKVHSRYLNFESGKSIYKPRDAKIGDTLMYKNPVSGVQDTLGQIIEKLDNKIVVNKNGKLKEVNIGKLKSEGVVSEVERLNPFTNDRFGERIMRERIKEKASKGYEKYRLPTGETIGKIEGFENPTWTRMNEYGQVLRNDTQLTTKNMKVGERVSDGADNEWIITDILGDGRFKAVPKSDFGKGVIKALIEKNSPALNKIKETFDLTGKSNPQYRRYSDWGKFLKNKYGGKEVIDTQGNSWMEIDLKKEMGRFPIEAFGILPFLPQKDKEE